MPIILAKPPTASAVKNVYSASDIFNDSTVSGVTVKDALNVLSAGGGLDVGRFVYNEPLTVVSGLVVFMVSNPPVLGTVQVYTNGLLQEPGVGKDYVISGSLITFNIDIELDDILLASYVKEI